MDVVQEFALVQARHFFARKALVGFNAATDGPAVVSAGFSVERTHQGRRVHAQNLARAAERHHA
jgi:hypothetical protein